MFVLAGVAVVSVVVASVVALAVASGKDSCLGRSAWQTAVVVAERNSCLLPVVVSGSSAAGSPFVAGIAASLVAWP